MKTVRTYRVNYFRVQSCYLLATEFHKIHKNTHTPVPKSFLIKLQDGGLQFYQKRDFVTGLLRTFKKRLFYRAPFSKCIQLSLDLQNRRQKPPSEVFYKKYCS